MTNKKIKEKMKYIRLKASLYQSIFSYGVHNKKDIKAFNKLAKKYKKLVKKLKRKDGGCRR